MDRFWDGFWGRCLCAVKTLAKPRPQSVDSIKLNPAGADASFWITADGVKFNETPDYVGIWGWNTAYVGGYNVVPGEPSMAMQIESNYDTGSDNWMEWFIAYHPDSGPGQGSRRPFQTAVSRTTHECWNTVTGRTSWLDNDGTQNIVFGADGSVSLVRSYINQVTNNAQFLKQISADGNSLLNVVYLDNLVFSQLIDCSTNGVHIISTVDGSTQNWADVESGFNYNDSSGYTYFIYASP